MVAFDFVWQQSLIINQPLIMSRYRNVHIWNVDFDDRPFCLLLSKNGADLINF